MLYTETVEPGALSLLKKLMGLETLHLFSLVGGTALSLRYGHRKSIDLDLFSPKEFDIEAINKNLKTEFGKDYSTESATARWGIFCYIQDVKVDIIQHPHRLISAVDIIDGIRMFGNPDIIAMKLNAILGRGKKKDFWDLYELLHHYSLKEMIAFHEKKFSEQNLLITIPQAIVYFNDAEESEDPVSLKGQTWESVKNFIQEKVSEFLK